MAALVQTKSESPRHYFMITCNIIVDAQFGVEKHDGTAAVVKTQGNSCGPGERSRRECGREWGAGVGERETGERDIVKHDLDDVPTNLP